MTASGSITNREPRSGTAAGRIEDLPAPGGPAVVTRQVPRRPGSPLPDGSPEAIAAFRARELALAVANERCIVDVGHHARRMDVIDDHRVALVSDA